MYLARYDALTNLANRRHLGEHLDALFALPARERAFALHIIDLDRFKFINDTYGHPFGDIVLKRVADRLLALARPSDLVVRLGGDEFAIVQSLRFARIEAQALAERICRELAQPFEVGNAKVVIGTSVGIGLATEDASSASELLKSADLALYAAKADDKGGFRFYDAGMTRAVHERADIENGLSGRSTTKSSGFSTSRSSASRNRRPSATRRSFAGSGQSSEWSPHWTSFR